MNNNNTYACPYCKKKHATPADLAHCILACEDKKKIEEEKAREKELAEIKEIRKQEVKAAEEHYRQLLTAYIHDYGSYDDTRCFDGDDADIFPFMFGSKPWRMFL